MRVIVIGVGGLLGSNVLAAARETSWEVVGTYHTTSPDFDVPLSKLDICDDERFRTILDRHDPDAVVNCAAMTDVDECEREPERAYEINGRAPRHLARICQKSDIRFVHVSTDYVFDGNAETPRRESDETEPIQVYGKSKLNGDRSVVEAHSTPLVVRPSFVYGVHRATGDLAGFPRWVRDRLVADETTPLFTDQRITPTRAGQAAETLLELLTDEATGVFHVASRSCVTPYRFGEVIGRHADASEENLEKSSMSDLDRPAGRPRYTCLNVGKVESTLGRSQPTLEEDVDAITESLAV